MRYIADLHLHSRHSIATSRESDPVHLFEAAARKGIDLVGTGDLTHPGWRAEMARELEPDGDSGFFRLRPELEREARNRLPASCREAGVRFVLSGEISSIYKKAGRARKVHNVVLMPDMDSVERLCAGLERIGNIRSDGRPILGLDCRDLLEMCLSANAGCCFIPAHIWTPHFSVFGSRSGFDRIEDCYGDLTGQIYALETGLSSDPPMNWRVSALDRFALVSNSDAHSPDKLGREANLIDDEFSWDGITGALKSRDPARFSGTLEFYPEEGKYHYDGHRACGVRLNPDQSRELGGRCPVCGGKLTGGVYGRVVELADRPASAVPDSARHYERLVPLREVLSEVLDKGPATKQTNLLMDRVISRLGPELFVLREASLEEISHCAGPLAAEAVRRVRAGELRIDPGYDGEYGTVRIFEPGERQTGSDQFFFFGQGEDAGLTRLVTETVSSLPPPRMVRENPRKDRKIDFSSPAPSGAAGDSSPLASLNDSQREAVTADDCPLAVVAGPGTGKTRCLAVRAWRLVVGRSESPDRLTALTFTNRAAREMRGRIAALPGMDGGKAGAMFIGTFHAWCLDFLTSARGRPPVLLDENERLELLNESLPSSLRRSLRGISEAVSLALASLESPERYRGPESVREGWAAYRDSCRRLGVLDFDSLIAETVRLLGSDPRALENARERCSSLLVDEFQDVNPAQYELVRLLAGSAGHGLFVIGDPNQSIYAFRGAQPEVFERLTADWPETRTIRLERGYRCGESVSGAAASLIAADCTRREPPAPLDRMDRPVRLMRCPSETAEAIAVLREVQRLVGGVGMLDAHVRGPVSGPGKTGSEENDYSFGDFLVVARTSSLLGEFERVFVTGGIPCRVRGSRSFLEDRGVQGLLAFLRLAADPSDDFRCRRALRLTGLDPENEYFIELNRAAVEHNRSLVAELKVRLSREAPFSQASARAAGFLVRLERCRRELDRTPPEALLRALAEEFLPARLGEDSPVEMLFSVAGRFDSVRDFLRRTVLQAEGDLEHVSAGSKSHVEAVTLSTMHAAKGLEFPVVFVCCLEEGLLPFTRGECDPAEERRLLYVAMTRASRRLYLSSASRRVVRGISVRAGWSPFIADIPAALCEDYAPTPLPGRPPDRQLDLL